MVEGNGALDPTDQFIQGCAKAFNRLVDELVKIRDTDPSSLIPPRRNTQKTQNDRLGEQKKQT